MKAESGKILCRLKEKKPALLYVYSKSVNNKENQLEADRKDRKILFLSLRHEETWRLCFSPTGEALSCISVVTRMWVPLANFEILFFLYIYILFLYFLTTAVISGNTVQMNWGLPLWSIMQCHFFRGLLMRSSASFGSTMEMISPPFCLKGDAVLLIKLGSKLVLQLSVEKPSSVMEPSKCQRIITQ